MGGPKQGNFRGGGRLLPEIFSRGPSKIGKLSKNNSFFVEPTGVSKQA